MRVSVICRFPRQASRVPEVEHQVGEPQVLSLDRRTGADPDPREEHVEGERLREVVVGARVEPANDLLGSIARGQQQDRRANVLAAQPSRDLETVHERAASRRGR